MIDTNVLVINEKLWLLVNISKVIIKLYIIAVKAGYLQLSPLYHNHSLADHTLYTVI